MGMVTESTLLRAVVRCGATFWGLRLRDGTLVIRVARRRRAEQIRISDGDAFDPARSGLEVAVPVDTTSSGGWVRIESSTVSSSLGSGRKGRAAARLRVQALDTSGDIHVGFLTVGNPCGGGAPGSSAAGCSPLSANRPAWSRPRAPRHATKTRRSVAVISCRPGERRSGRDGLPAVGAPGRRPRAYPFGGGRMGWSTAPAGQGLTPDCCRLCASITWRPNGFPER